MTCAACTGHVSGALVAVPGMATASVSFERQLATIAYDPARVEPAALVSAVSALDGYTATEVIE